jgi:hypothetical protein
MAVRRIWRHERAAVDRASVVDRAAVIDEQRAGLAGQDACIIVEIAEGVGGR